MKKLFSQATRHILLTIHKNIVFKTDFLFVFILTLMHGVGTLSVEPSLKKWHSYSFIYGQQFNNHDAEVYANNNPQNYIDFSLNTLDKNGEFACQSTGSSTKTLFIEKSDGSIVSKTKYETDEVGEAEKITHDKTLTVLSNICYLRHTLAIPLYHFNLSLMNSNGIYPLKELHIPNEITSNILQYLSLKDLITMYFVSKDFKAMIDTFFAKEEEVNAFCIRGTIKQAKYWDDTHVVNIITQICSNDYYDNCYILPTTVFRLPFQITDISWAIDLFLNQDKKCRFSLENEHIKYNHQKNHPYDPTQYKNLAYACFPKRIATLALKYYESSEQANILDWHILNTTTNPTEQKKWIKEKNIKVNINNSTCTVNGVLLYQTCFKWLWEYAKQPISEYRDGSEVKNLKYSFYHQPLTLLCLLKVLKHDLQDGIINQNNLKKYLKEMEYFYKDIFPKESIFYNAKGFIDQHCIKILIKKMKLQVPQEDRAIMKNQVPQKDLTIIVKKIEAQSKDPEQRKPVDLNSDSTNLDNQPTKTKIPKNTGPNKKFILIKTIAAATIFIYLARLIYLQYLYFPKYKTI